MPSTPKTIINISLDIVFPFLVLKQSAFGVALQKFEEYLRDV